ncbi:MAG: prephenate dehydrogenase/arogenate dehydrogenase family protein [Myxococcales bacterium]|nr:prephenate dehydrogenase/arogenate dehydrogenase family protein [Myxococcales bacterium]MCB9708641.1 prephenate dehydrogenase/arogenate dehydrogenase family protein [Myxococcales bacterium]
MIRVAVIGYGRFGKLLSSLLAKEMHVQVYDPSQSDQSGLPNIEQVEEATALACETIFYAVPIHAFRSTLEKHVSHFCADKMPRLIVDTLSVKSLPKKALTQLLPSHVTAILTHPMFGPDSVREQGLHGLPVVMDQFTASHEDYAQWKSFFERQGLKTIELSADAHDRAAAWSQGVAHFIGRVLDDMKLAPSDIDTLGARRLLELRDQVCNDSWELFTDLQTYNPYTIDMRVRLGKAVDAIYNRLLPNRVHSERWEVGIQGGKGSFNEQAALYYLGRNGIKEHNLHYLYTTEAVLKALHEGKIDRGQFAVHNSLGGMVDESVEAMANYKFHIIEQFAIKIAHALMIRGDATLETVRAIMAHPQVFRQCQRNLDEKYGRLVRVSGTGDLIDSAHAARQLADGAIDSGHAVMGPRVLAELFGLTLVEDNLQDLADNYTSFLWVERP